MRRSDRGSPEGDGPATSPPDPGAASLGGDLHSKLTRWVAEAKVDEAARNRAREGWMRRQAVEETSMTAVLTDLAERGRALLIHSRAGTRHRGIIEAIGTDFVSLSAESGAETLIHLDSVTAVRTQPGEPPAASGRPAILDLCFRDAISVLADTRPRTLVATGPNDTFVGELDYVGKDVICLRLDGDGRPRVYLPIDAVLEMTPV